MKPDRSRTRWIRFHQSQRGFRRLSKHELPYFGTEIIAWSGVIEALRREKGLTWDECRTWMEGNSGYGTEHTIYEAMIRVMERPEWAQSVKEWRELDRAKETLVALEKWKRKKNRLPISEGPELNGVFCL